MNKDITIYTELDSLFDTKRGIIQILLTEQSKLPPESRKEESDRIFSTYIEKNYKNRKLDTFSYDVNGVKVNREKFLKRYSERSLGDWSYFYPTNLVKAIRKIVVDLELTGDKPLDIRSMTLYINLHPFNFDEGLIKDLVAHMQTALGRVIKVKTLNTDVSKQTLSYYGKFNYVFKYDAFISEETKPLQESIGKVNIPETKFIVPDILVKDSDSFKGETIDRIYALSTLLAPSVVLVPVKHEVYDYSS